MTVAIKIYADINVANHVIMKLFDLFHSLMLINTTGSPSIILITQNFTGVER